MNSDLRYIKKHYGENMMHFCRKYFPTILEHEGTLTNIMNDAFAPNKFLFDDIVEQGQENNFILYINKLYKPEIYKEIVSTKSPKDLMAEAGYDLYECKTEEDVQSFKKYYAPGEELCTFRDETRLESYYIFFAVKKNVDEIKREDFDHPEREDLYGTSVMSIQFYRGALNTVSIKNRYNHAVQHPDSTYNNNLDKIIPGLIDSFKNKYSFVMSVSDTIIELDGYVKDANGKFHKYNCEFDNNYYCINNIVLEDQNPIRYDNRYLVADSYIFDLKDKKLINPDSADYFSYIMDGVNSHIKEINITRDGEYRNVRIFLDKKEFKEPFVEMKINSCNRIISFKSIYLKKIGDGFLLNSDAIEEIELPNVEEIGGSFLDYAPLLKEISLPKVKKVADSFLGCVPSLKRVYLPNLVEAGNVFMDDVEMLEEIELPNLEKVGNDFLADSPVLKRVSLPKLTKVGSNFLSNTEVIEELYLPSLDTVGASFMIFNNSIKKLYLPKVRIIGNYFLGENESIERLSLPNVEEIGIEFIAENSSFNWGYFPKLKRVDDHFLEYVENANIYMPNVPDIEIRLSELDYTVNPMDDFVYTTKPYGIAAKKLFLRRELDLSNEPVLGKIYK